MIKLSFIVPVYNVEKYLRKCVESLINQDYSDYEIILVDDGSTDGSGELCDELATHPLIPSSSHPSIRVLHQANAGLSAARNSGIKAANGEYLCFVDSDDYWQPNVLGGLMQQVEHDNLDVLRFNYQNVNEQYEVFQPNKDPKRDVDYSTNVTDGETFLNERLGPACYVVMFIIRKEILNLQSPIFDVKFTEGIYFEDTEWTPRMLLRANRVASTPQIVYNYLWRSGSITLPTDPVKRDKVLHDKIALLNGFKEQRKLVRNPIWFDWMTSFNTMTILEMLIHLPASKRKPYIGELKSLRIFPLYTKKEKGLKKLKIHLANVSPELFCTLMSIRI